MAQSMVLQDSLDTLTLLVPCGDSERTHVKVSFFGTIEHGRVGAPDVTEDGVLHVASLDHLMATKVKVILQRAEARDYRDIAAIINAGVSLSKGLASARALHASPGFCALVMTLHRPANLYSDCRIAGAGALAQSTNVSMQ